MVTSELYERVKAGKFEENTLMKTIKKRPLVFIMNAFITFHDKLLFTVKVSFIAI